MRRARLAVFANLFVSPQGPKAERSTCETRKSLLRHNATQLAQSMVTLYIEITQAEDRGDQGAQWFNNRNSTDGRPDVGRADRAGRNWRGPEHSEARSASLLSKVSKRATQLTGIIGAASATFTFIGGVWLAAVAAIVPGSGIAFSNTSLTGLIALLAFSGTWLSFVLGGALGLPGFYYRSVIGKTKPREKNESMWAERFRAQTILFAGNCTIGLLSIFLAIRFPNAWTYVTFALDAALLATFQHLYKRFNVSATKEETVRHLLGAVFATFSFGIPTLLAMQLVLNASSTFGNFSVLVFALLWTLLIYITNSAYAIDGAKFGCV